MSEKLTPAAIVVTYLPNSKRSASSDDNEIRYVNGQRGITNLKANEHYAPGLLQFSYTLTDGDVCLAENRVIIFHGTFMVARNE